MSTTEALNVQHNAVGYVGLGAMHLTQIGGAPVVHFTGSDACLGGANAKNRPAYTRYPVESRVTGKGWPQTARGRCRVEYTIRTVAACLHGRRRFLSPSRVAVRGGRQPRFSRSGASAAEQPTRDARLARPVGHSARARVCTYAWWPPGTSTSSRPPSAPPRKPNAPPGSRVPLDTAACRARTHVIRVPSKHAGRTTARMTKTSANACRNGTATMACWRWCWCCWWWCWWCTAALAPFVIGECRAVALSLLLRFRRNNPVPGWGGGGWPARLTIAPFPLVTGTVTPLATPGGGRLDVPAEV